jgi:hypothetical protein
VFRGRGDLLGRGAVGGVTLPSATSCRIRSSERLPPAGTRSATGRPREVTLICSPFSTRRITLLKFAFNSRTPISRM